MGAGSNLSGTNNYAAYGGSIIGANNSGQIKITVDEFGNTVPLPLQGNQNNQMMYMDDEQ